MRSARRVLRVVGGRRAAPLGLLVLAFWSASGCSGETAATGARPGDASATAGKGGAAGLAAGGTPQSAVGGSGQLETGGGGAALGVGGAAEAGQPPLAEGGRAGQAPEWPTGLVNEFGFGLEDSWLLMPCLKDAGNHACWTTIGECPKQGATDVEQRGYRFAERFQLGGEPEASYDVTLRINGTVEGKYYEGGVRRRGADFSDSNNVAGTDAWYTGGSAVSSTYAIYKLTVFESDGVTEVQHYYLNSFPQASGLESHQTVVLGYEATISVPGQGIIEYLSVEPDCYTNDNCSSSQTAACQAPRYVPNEPGLLLPKQYGGQPLASLNVVTGDQQPFHSHILHVVVTDVVTK